MDTVMELIKPPYNFDNSCYFDEENKIRFEPPIYEQRYLTVLRLLELDLWKDSFKKVVEFGCAEMKFFTLLKTLQSVEQILEVDIDEELISKWAYTVRPLMVDFIQRRPSKFAVEVWRGSIASYNECLQDTDVVIGIEIIEHLFPLVLEAIPHNIFGLIRPKVAMFSTPNSEYNVHFDGLLETGFRHEDHKFEWTRAQFREWCENICQRFPEYVVKYFGIGPQPKDSPDVGPVSQMGVFVRKDFLEVLEAKRAAQAEGGVVTTQVAPTVQSEEPPGPSGEGQPAEPKIYFDEEVGEIVMERDEDPDDFDAAVAPGEGLEEFRDVLDEVDSNGDDIDPSDDEDQPLGRDIDYYVPVERSRNDSGNYDDELLDPTSDEYKLIYSVDYPVQEPDLRQRPERLLEEAEYQIRRLRLQQEDYYHYEENEYRIPLQLVVSCMNVELTTDLDELRPILAGASYRISEENVITLNGDDESVLGSEEDFEYDLDEEEVPAEGEQGNAWDGADGGGGGGGGPGSEGDRLDEELWD
ncbi:uncharacterized protein LOC120420120 [Culex pipiens pallens]|uniref:uncharacterized protein LOC120420120 n=1 Tax=Culex pipiens pallens TaxID=42434 RepID=UPI001953F9C4|nr:uncharacterized protein LOC120420120 [Culex pipiens pallens]